MPFDLACLHPVCMGDGEGQGRCASEKWISCSGTQQLNWGHTVNSKTLPCKQLALPILLLKPFIMDGVSEEWPGRRVRNEGQWLESDDSECRETGPTLASCGSYCPRPQTGWASVLWGLGEEKEECDPISGRASCLLTDDFFLQASQEFCSQRVGLRGCSAHLHGMGQFWVVQDML